MRLVDVDSLYRHLFTCSDGRICPDTDIDNWPIQFDVKTIKKIIRKEPIVFEFDIPDNATNGEVIKAMFEPNWIRRMDDVVREEYEFDADWWKAPYQKGGKE